MLNWWVSALWSTVVSPSRDTGYLTGLRAYAAFAVVAIHTGLGGIGGLGAFFSNLVNHGKHGVPLFFVLSGYTIALSIYKSDKFSYALYWRRRCSRILPLYFGLIVFLFLIGYEGSYWAKELDAPNDFFSLVAHVFFLNVYLSQYSNNIIGVEWSIPVEFFYYTIIPSMAFLAKKPFGWVLLCVFAYVFSRFGLILPSPFADGSEYRYLAWGWQPFRYVWCFVLGVCLASLCTHLDVVKRA